MNLRILKKKSKQAAFYLTEYYGFAETDLFLAERGENYHGLKIRCPHKSGRFRCCCCYYHPLKGTPMKGGMSGYYEPEWSEHTTFEELCEHVLWGEKPSTMPDDAWQRVLRITGVTPISINDIIAMLGDGE